MYGKLSKYVPRRESLVQAANTLSTYSLQDYASTAQGYAQTAAAQLVSMASALLCFESVQEATLVQSVDRPLRAFCAQSAIT